MAIHIFTFLTDNRMWWVQIVINNCNKDIQKRNANTCLTNGLYTIH